MSGSATPDNRFTTSQISNEQQIKDQTVGLVHLSDFRKRTAEALISDGRKSGTSTPQDEDDGSIRIKKKLKKAKKGGLSFNVEGDDAGFGSSGSATPDSKRGNSSTPGPTTDPDGSTAMTNSDKKLSANAGVGFVAKSQTKSSLAREAHLKEQLRREYLAVQARVKATEFIMPFVFFSEGKDTPGGRARLKKGDQVWRFLDQAKRIGAEQSGKGLRQWARVNVDDLMLVKDFIILPQHFEFYWFMQNRAKGYSGELFPYASDVTDASPTEQVLEEKEKPVAGLSVPGQRVSSEAGGKANEPSDSDLEGYDADATTIKVVLRPWYERNKHIYPMSTWKEFSTEVDYSKEVRKDADGNAFFNAA